jgi:hypothetical protein
VLWGISYASLQNILQLTKRYSWSLVQLEVPFHGVRGKNTRRSDLYAYHRHLSIVFHRAMAGAAASRSQKHNASTVSGETTSGFGQVQLGVGGPDRAIGATAHLQESVINS